MKEQSIAWEMVKKEKRKKKILQTIAIIEAIGIAILVAIIVV